MTLVYFYTVHSGLRWIQREATVFFLTESCCSPRRFVFCYQGRWFISEHFGWEGHQLQYGKGEDFFD